MKHKERKDSIKCRTVTGTVASSYSSVTDGFCAEEELVSTPSPAPLQSRYTFWHWVVPPVFLSLFTAGWYYPSLYYAFQFDDLANIVKFFDIRHKTFSHLFMTSTRWMSAWLNTVYYKIGKFDPWAYRVGNVIEHCIAGFLLFFVLFLALNRLRKHRFFKEHAWSIATLTTALFLLHPVQTQTVSYVIQGQLEGLAGFFIIAISFCFILAYTVRTTVLRVFLLLCMYILAFLSMGTKEIAIVSPLLMLVIDWFFIAQGDWQSLKKRALVHAGLWVVVMGTYFYLVKPKYFMSLFSREIRNNIGNVLTDHPATTIRMGNYSISQFKVILHYMGIFILPSMMSVDYDWKISRSFFAPDSFFPFVLLLLLVGFVVYRLRKNNTDILSAGIIWFFIAILPRASIIPATELLADYKTYTSSIGILLLMASVLIALFKKMGKLQWSAMGLCVVFLGYLTYSRNLVWQSSVHFWEDIIRHAPGRARAYNNYGVALSEKGEYSKAIENFKRAMSMDRNYSDPCNNIAVAYSVVGKIDDAIAAIRQSLRIQPYYPEGYNNLASFLMQKKEYDQVEQVLHTALKLRPHYGKAYFNLGRLYLEQGDKQKAFEAFKNSCTKADFDNEIGFGAYGAVAMQLGKHDEAITAYSKALECKPGIYEYMFNLANAYFLQKEYAKSHNLYKQLCGMHPNDMRVAFNVAETCMALEDFDQAITYYQKASALERSPAVIYRSAECYKQLGKKHEARACCNELLAGDYDPVFKKRARALMAQL